MGKSFKGFSKALSLILAVAMVVTCVPTSAYAADLLAGESEDLLISNDNVAEEASDALVDASASEENSSTSIDTQTASAPSDDADENTAGEEVEPDGSYGDVTLKVSGTRNNMALVTLAGDLAASVVNGNYGLDSAIGYEAYVVPQYGYTLGTALTINLVGAYTDAQGAHNIATTDWSKSTVDLSYLDADGQYEWKKATKIALPSTDWLKAYAAATNKSTPLELTVANTATANAIPFTVKVDGAEKASGYESVYNNSNTTGKSLEDSVKKEDFGDYDFSLALVDSTGKIKQAYTANATGNDNVGTGPAYKDCMTTAHDAYAYYLDSSDGKLYVSTYGINQAYKNIKENGYTLLAEFKKKSTATEKYNVLADNTDYATIKEGGIAGSGDTIKTTADKVQTDATTDVVFNVDVVNTASGRRLKSNGVKYFIKDMTNKAVALGYDSTNGLFDGETADYTYTRVPDATAMAASDPSPVGNTWYYLNGTTYTAASESQVFTSGTPSSDPQAEGFYEKGSSVYAPSEDTTVDGGKTYYQINAHYPYYVQGGHATGSHANSPKVYGIPYGPRGISGAPTNEPKKGDITIYVETEDLVTYELPADAVNNGKSLVSISDGGSFSVTAGSTVITSGTGAPQNNTTYATTGEKYTFTVTPGPNLRVKSVTAKMITDPKGTNMSNITLTEDDYGQYTIDKVLGAVKIIVTTESSSTATDVKRGTDTAGQVTLKERASGIVIDGASNKNAEDGKPFSFVAIPNSTYAVDKVEYTMGDSVKTATAVPLTKEKANGEKVYTIDSIDGDATITVAQVRASDVVKKKNPDAILTFNDEVIKDDAKIRAAQNKDLTFNVKAAEGAEIVDVHYSTGALTATTINDTNKLTKPTSANPDGSLSYTLGKSVITDAATADINLYIVTKRVATSADFTATVKSKIDNKNVEEIKLRAGGKSINAAAVEEAVRAQDTLTPTFLYKDGKAITPTKTFKLGIPATNTKTCVATITAGGVIQTTDVAGTDTLTISLEDKTSAFPKTVEYKKELPVTVEPLSSMYDKVELKSVVTANGAKSGFAADSKTIRVYNAGSLGTAINDQITYSIYPYTTSNGVSVKADTALQNSSIGAGQAIDTIDWKGTPEVAATVKPADKLYNLTGLTTSATATIDTAKKVGTVDVTATLNFADGSMLTTAPETLTVADKIYGYFAIPTITVGTATTFNGNAIALETVGSTKTATVKWDIYKVNSEAAFIKLTNNNGSELPTYTGAGGIKGKDAKTFKGYVDEGSITLVSPSEVTFTGAKLGDGTVDYATVSGSDNMTVTAAKKGNTTLNLLATVAGVPVAVNPINLSVQNNISTFEVKFDPQSTSAATGNKGNYYDLDTSKTDFDYPTFADTAAIKSLGTVSEMVTTVGSDKKSIGFVITNMKNETIVELPGEEAFVASSIDPKIKLYGWYDTAGNKYYKIGDKATVTRPTTFRALWAYKYDGGIAVYRYDGGVKTAIANNDTINLVKSTEDNEVVIPVVAGYKVINVEKGPATTGTVGNPQYDKEVIDESGAKLKLENPSGGKLDATALSAGKLKSSLTLATNANVTIKYVDGTDAVYDTAGSAGNQIKAAGIEVTTTGVAKTYTLTFTDAEVEEGETKDIAAVIKDSAGTVIPAWNNSSTFLTVSAKVADANKEILKTNDVVMSTSNISVTGLKASQTPVAVTVTATDVNGNKAEGTVNVTVKSSGVKIIPTVKWSAGGVSFSEEQTTGTIYARVGVPNTIEWNVTKNGVAVATGNVFEATDKTADIASVKAGTDVEWSLGSPISTSSAKSITANPLKLGLGSIEVKYTEEGGKVYTATFPVTTYQAVSVIAPTDTLKDVYAVYKNGTALAAGKNSVEKLVYETGKVNYTFDSTPYTTSWIADSTIKYDPYWWAAATNVTATPGITAKGAKVLDLGASKTQTKVEWEAGGLVLAAAYDSKKLELTNIPDTITLSDETLSTITADGTDVATIKMGVTPYDSANWVGVTGSDYDMYMLARGERSKKALNNPAEYGAWWPAHSTVDAKAYASTSHVVTGTDYDATKKDLDIVELVTLPNDGNGGVHVAEADKATVTSGKSRTDTFTVAKINDPALGKQYVGKSKITVKANGGDYKEVTLYINGEYDTGKVDVDGNAIIHYMKNGEDLQDGIVTVQGKKHYYKNGARVNDGIFNDNGKLILINAGAQVTDEGRATYDAKQYYIGADGFVKTGLFTAKDGKQYLATKDGEMITYKATQAAGTPGEITVDGVEYVINTDDTAQAKDKKIVTKVGSFVWSPAKNADYKTDTVVTATVDVEYKLEKAQTTGKETLNATVVLDPSSTSKKKIYNATVTAGGYFKDATTVYDWSTVKDSKTYTVDESGHGTKEGLTVEGLEASYDYTGSAIKPAFTVVDSEFDKVLVEKTDYTVKWTNNNPNAKTALPVTATITITGKGNYDKQVITRQFQITDPMDGKTATDYFDVKSVKVEKEATPLTFDGTPKYPSKLTIKTADKKEITATWNGSSYDLSDTSKDLEIIVTNNVNKGSGTVAVFGSNFKKPVKKTFSIAAADLSTAGEKLEITADAATYTKTGAKAKVTVTFDNGSEKLTLVEGRDYKVTYAYSGRKDAGEKAGQVFITGKNNFKGNTKKTNVANFDIEKLVLADENIVVDAYEKVAAKSIKVKVFDSEGNEVATKNYSISKVEKGSDDITGTATKLVAGDDITVTVKGTGTNVDEAEHSVNVTVGVKMGSVKFNAKSLTKTYTGEPVTLDSTDLEKVAATVKINKVDTKLAAGTDYEVVGYKNNNKKGTMTVFVRGIGDKVSGYGKFTVKILPKQIVDADK